MDVGGGQPQESRLARTVRAEDDPALVELDGQSTESSNVVSPRRTDTPSIRMT